MITTVAFDAPIALFQRRINAEPGVIRVLPLTLAVALACVLVSRAAGFQPGYIYGIIAGYAFARPLARREAGLAVAASCVFILGLAMAAWLVLPTVDASLTGAPWLDTVATTLLAVIFIGGLEGLLLELVPLRFLRGTAIWNWHRGVWLALFVVAGFAFVHVLLHPGTTYLFEARGQAIAVAILFGLAFAALSVSFWAYFRFRATPVEPAESVG